MERDVDALEGDGGEASLKVYGLGFLVCLVRATADDVDQAAFDVFEGERFHEAVNVYFLSFEEVGYACEAVEGTELGEKVNFSDGWRELGGLTSPAQTYCMFATL